MSMPNDTPQSSSISRGIENEPKGPRVNDYVMFFAALTILAVVMWFGFVREELQYNVIFAIALSLACAMVIAFLPFTANFGVQWFRATGSAAVFAVCLWQTVPFARDTTTANFKFKIQSQGRVIESALTTLSNATKQFQNATNLVRAAESNFSDAGTCSKRSTQALEILRPQLVELGHLRGGIEAVQTTLALGTTR
jgi:hypothetical protein